jgi:HD-GYP domain-containing protein (c-di-GMP phosphodiesterase class II)
MLDPSGTQRAIAHLEVANEAILEAFSRALDLREGQSQGHTLVVAELAVRLAGAVGITGADLIQIKYGALLHDIGMLAVPDSILQKAGPLDENELAVVRKHPLHGHEILSPVAYLHIAATIPLHHHERWDGLGYPYKLRAEAIPLPARIFSVVDIWDALLSSRPHRPAWPSQETLAHMRTLAGSHCDPKIVAAFLEGRIWQAPA